VRFRNRDQDRVMSTLKIENLHVSVAGTPILKGVDLEIRSGEIHALMGPNGSGKSTLAYALAGHPAYEVTEGTIDLDGTNVLELEPDQRARLGLYLAFQYPVTIPGVKVADFLRHAVSNIRNPARKEGDELISMREFRRELYEHLDALGVDRSFARRYLNEGFSGGEKKRMEIVQMAMLRPRFAILDETDSGLDTDAVNVVSEGVQRLSTANQMGVLIITHHERLLQYNIPLRTHVMLAGRIVETGDASLAHELHAQGYAGVRERHPEAAAEEREKQQREEAVAAT
jgi:Fe-S cluster assembly ATP-binding protein